MTITGYLYFHKAKLHFIYLNLLPNSVFKNLFQHFHSRFQQLQLNQQRYDIHSPLGHFTLCSLVQPQLTVTFLEYNLPSYDRYITPILTNLQHSLWPVSLLLLALICLLFYALSFLVRIVYA